MLKDLDTAVRQHTGEFLCEEIHNERNTKVVHFAHVATEPTDLDGVPDVGDLREFYSTFGSILFYHDGQSGDAGKYLAPIESWGELQEYFSGWLEGLEEDEGEELLPKWVETALVIGETPQSGNYILVPTEGVEAGHVFEFDHDGFEFCHEADSLGEYVVALMNPNSAKLTEIASHMRFIEGDAMVQWWIRGLKDNRGHMVHTEV